MTRKTWLADGITDENGPAAKRAGAEILGRALVHEALATEDFTPVREIVAKLGFSVAQAHIAIRAGLELAGGDDL